MRVRAVGTLVVVGLAGVVAGCGDGDENDRSDAVVVEHAWALPTVAAATTGAVYLEVWSPIDDVLVGASVDPAVAARVSFHDAEEISTGVPGSMGHDMPEREMASDSETDHDMATMDHDMVSMMPVASYPLGPGEELQFAPGVRHIMLEDLAVPLEVGETFELTLEFDRAPAVAVPVTVTANFDR